MKYIDIKKLLSICQNLNVRAKTIEIKENQFLFETSPIKNDSIIELLEGKYNFTIYSIQEGKRSYIIVELI